MATVSKVNIADAIAYTRERERQAEIDRRLASIPAFDMADCILSGLCGPSLTKALAHHFPQARRSEVFSAIGLASAIWAADLTACEMELAILRNEGGRT